MSGSNEIIRNGSGGQTAISGDAETAWLARVAKHRIDAIAGHCRKLRLEPRTSHFLFLRHGETQGNHLRIFQHAEIELNETGLSQARQAAALMAGFGISRIVASSMRRAWQTATVVERELQALPIAEPRLRERWFGDLVGTSSVDLDWSYDPPNGEPLADFVQRSCQGLNAALGDYASTLVVAHGGTLYVLAYSLGIKLRHDLVTNATPLLFRRQGEDWRVSALADAPIVRGANIGW